MIAKEKNVQTLEEAVTDVRMDVIQNVECIQSISYDFVQNLSSLVSFTLFTLNEKYAVLNYILLKCKMLKN